MDHEKLIVERIELVRSVRGMSKAELARRAGISRKRLWYILDGERVLHGDELVRLSMVLGLRLEHFLTPGMERRLIAARRLLQEAYGTAVD